MNADSSAVWRALKSRGARKLKDLWDQIKLGSKALNWFWKQFDDAVDSMIGIAVGEIIGELAQDIVDNSPGISYSVAKDYVRANYKSSIKGINSSFVLGAANNLKEEFNGCSAGNGTGIL